MRKPFCLHCGEKITHFGRGYKWMILKYRGGYIHFNCYNKSQYIKEENKRNRIKREISPTKRQRYNKQYYQRHRERILKTVKAYQARRVIQVVV